MSGFGGLAGGSGEPISNSNGNPRGFKASKRGPGTKARGARRHQGATEEAPRRQLAIGKGPRALKKRTTI